MGTTSLDTTGAVIDALGGTKAVGSLTGSADSAVSNWRSNGKFPSNTYLLLKAALGRRAAETPDSLWGMREVESERAST